MRSADGQMIDMTADDLQSPLMTLKQASKYLCCSYSTTLRLASTNELESCRIASAWRTSKQACDSFIKKQFAAQRAINQSVEVDADD